MRSCSCMSRLPSGVSIIAELKKEVARSSRAVRLFLLGTRNGLGQDAASIRGIAPLSDADPLVDFEVLIVGEEVLDLLKHDRGQVLPLADIGIIREGCINGHADELFVPAMLILQIEDADRAS